MDIEQLRSICLALPGVTEEIKWDNDLCFLIGGRMFCVCGTEPPLQIAFKAGQIEFRELTEIPGIIPAPYLARYHWVQVQDLNRFSRPEWKTRIHNSYEMIKAALPKKKLKELNLA